jgi:hypothetical protein
MTLTMNAKNHNSYFDFYQIIALFDFNFVNFHFEIKIKLEIMVKVSMLLFFICNRKGLNQMYLTYFG